MKKKARPTAREPRDFAWNDRGALREALHLALRDAPHVGRGFDDVTKVLTMDDLVRTADVSFVATGITDGDLVRGVRFFGNGARTHSIVMNSYAGTIRFVETVHRLRAEPFRVH